MRRTVLWAALVAAGCGSAAGTDAGPELPGALDAVGADVRQLPDASTVVEHDGGPPPACGHSCDCPQGLACIGEVCRAGLSALYCCAHAGCPAGRECLDEQDQPGLCPGDPDAGTPDSGPHDIGAGVLGSGCGGDLDCERGLTCLEETAPPFLWGGYCTLLDCLPSCPAQSTCLSFGVGNPSACMAICLSDRDCREDAFCLTIDATNAVCFPDCRDDLFDCAPRDGTSYCDRGTGRCEPNRAHNAAAVVGDPCSDNRDCAAGDVCMGAFAWNLPGGMCTHVCAGLAEATACSGTDHCEDFAGVGLCFAACTGGACPNRSGAICTALNASWLEPGCVPQ